MELQKSPDYKSNIKPHLDRLKADKLFSLLSRKRNFIVHQGMLELLSSGQIGTTEGRGEWKITIPFQIHPAESSDEAYERFQRRCQEDSFLRGLAGPDCDSWPMIRREWKIQEFPDVDILDLAIAAWRTSGEVISAILVHLGGESLDTTLACRHEPEAVRVKQFHPESWKLA